MKPVVTILLTIILITGIGGCSKCGDGYYVDINEMKLSAIYACCDGWVEEKNPVAYDSVVIRAIFSGTAYAATFKQSSLSFLPTAMANDECPGSLGSKETISNINVITLTDFDNKFKVNDTINSIIEANNNFWSGYSLNEFKNLSQFLAEIQPGISSDTQERGGIFLRLNKKPTQNVIKLRVDVAFTNGEKYSAETIPITIKQ